MDKLSEAVKLAHENGLTYAQLQILETLGEVRIGQGKIFKKCDEYEWGRENERNRRNT